MTFSSTDWEKLRKLQVRIFLVSVQILTEDLPNTIPRCFHLKQYIQWNRLHVKANQSAIALTANCYCGCISLLCRVDPNNHPLNTLSPSVMNCTRCYIPLFLPRGCVPANLVNSLNTSFSVHSLVTAFASCVENKGFCSQPDWLW